VTEFVATREGPAHHVDFGGAGSSFVLIHGLGGSTTNWIAVGPALSRQGRVRAIDLPGFGLTPPRRDFHLETHRDSVAAYLDELEAPTHTLIGNSTGGLLAEMVAAARPDLVERLVLVAPATPPRFPDPRLDWPTVARLAMQATPPIDEVYGRWFLRSNTPEQLTRKTLEMVTHKPGRVPVAVIEASRDMAAIRKNLPWAQYASARTATSIARHYAKRSFYVDMIRSIAAPALVVQGMSDHIVSPTAIEWMCSLRPDWDLIQLEDTGHTPMMDAPLRFLDVVGGWLARDRSIAVGV
jgi:pimeloyl-ACP methyl ester carboxylesterase